MPVFRVPAVCGAWALVLAGHLGMASLGRWEAEGPCRLAAIAAGAAALLAGGVDPRSPATGAVRRRAALAAAAASLLLAGGALGIEASRDEPPGEVHPAPLSVTVEGFVEDAAGAAETPPRLLLDARRVSIAGSEIGALDRVLAWWPRGTPPPTWATARTALRVRGSLTPLEDARNPGGGVGGGRRRRLSREGIAAVLAVEPGGVEAWSPPRDASRLRRSPWPSLLAEARRATADRFEAAAGPLAAALARGMLLGDRAGVEPETRESFRNAGTLHILSISGLHVCIVAGFLAAAARAARLGGAAAMALELAGLALYVVFVGAPAPALRSALLWTLSRGARLLGRASHPLAGWGAAGLILHLAAPDRTLDLGFALSFGAVLGLHAGGAVVPPPGAGSEGRRWRRLGAGVLAAVAAGCGGSIGTLPVEAIAFGSIPVMGPVANLVVIPLTTVFLAEAILVAIGAWALPAPLVDLLGGALDGVAAVLTAANDALGGRVEPFALHAPPPIVAGALSGAALLAAACLGASGAPRGGRRRFVAALCLLAAALAPVVPIPGLSRGAELPRAALLALDVGQGDAALLLGGGDEAIVVDAGPRDADRDAGRLTVEPSLRAEGIRRVAAAVSSHGHRDHEGGLPWLGRRRWLDQVIENGGGSSDRDAWRAALAASGGRARTPGSGGASLALPGWSVRVEGPRAGADVARHAPGRAPRPGSANAAENDRSLVAVAVARDGAGGMWSALFPGDLEREGEEAWLNSPLVATVDVLKVPHHGGRTSSTPAWIARTRPRVAIVSAGAGNRHGHPSPITVSRYRRAGAWVLRTDREGAIRVGARGGRLWISTRAHPGPRPVPERAGTAISPWIDFP